MLTLGARGAPTPGAVATACDDIAILCVTDSLQVEEILFAEHGLATSLGASSLIIDCSSRSPLANRDSASRLPSSEVRWGGCTRLGRLRRGAEGSLSSMVGSSELDTWRATGS